MNDFFGFIKALIDKVNFICFLLSIAVGILVFKVWTSDLLWAIFAFCMAYSCLCGINKFILRQYNEHCARVAREEREARKVKEEQEKDEQNRAYCSTIYESLSDEAKRGLIMLYRLPIPDGGFYSSRILDMNNKEHILILNAIYTVESVIFNNHGLIERDNVLNKVVIIDADFYKVLEEKSKTFEN